MRQKLGEVEEWQRGEREGGEKDINRDLRDLRRNRAKNRKEIQRESKRQ